MGFKSVAEENTRVEATHARVELQSKSSKIVSQLDPFLLQDFYQAVQQVYRLEIMNNFNGKASTYRLRDAQIDIDAFVSSAMLLPLKLEVEMDGNIDTLEFNISQIEANTDSSSLENPKYYIYCDNSDQIGFRFWFLKNK